MSTLTQGFIQGANLVRRAENDAFHQQRANKLDALRDTQDARHAERHHATLKRIGQQTEHERERHQAWQAGAPVREEAQALALDEAKRQATRAKTADAREQTEYDYHTDKRHQQDNLNWLQQHSQLETHAFLTEGRLSPEYYRRMQGTGYDIGKLLSPDVDTQLDFLAATLDPNDARVTPRDPRMLSAFNTVFAEEINQNLQGSVNPDTGAPASRKVVTSVHPVQGSPGEVYLGLRIEYADGTVRDAQPMTEGRNSDDDAALKPVAIGDMMQRVSAMKAYKDLLKRSGGVEKYQAYLSAQQQAHAAANRDSKGKQMTRWRGQTVDAKNLEKQFEMMQDRLSVDGLQDLITYEDFLWTEGDDEKLAVLRQVANINRQRLEYNAARDDDEPEQPLLSARDAWAAEQQTRARRAKDNPAQSTLDSIVNQEGPSGTPGEPVRRSPTLRPASYAGFGVDGQGGYIAKQMTANAQQGPADANTQHAQLAHDIEHRLPGMTPAERRKWLFDHRYQLTDELRARAQAL